MLDDEVLMTLPPHYPSRTIAGMEGQTGDRNMTHTGWPPFDKRRRASTRFDTLVETVGDRSDVGVRAS